MIEEYYWACSRDDFPAGERFVIANGQRALWLRVIKEINRDRICAWNRIRTANSPLKLEDIFSLYLCQAQTYRINHNKFLLEVAQIPMVARFLHDHGHMSALVSNPLYENYPIHQEPYDEKIAQQLAHNIECALSIGSNAIR